MSLLYEARFNGIRIDVGAVSDDGGDRQFARHRFPNGDGTYLEDLGDTGRVTSMRVVFLPHTDDATGGTYAERFERFVALRDGKAYPLIHPLWGRLTAKLTSVRPLVSVGLGEAIAVDAVFEEHEEPESYVAPVDLGAVFGSRTKEVAADVASLDAAVVEYNLGAESPFNFTVGQEALALVEAWEEETGFREAQYELTKLSREIQSVTDTLELATDVKAYPVLRALMRLNWSLTRAAQAVAAKTPRLTDVTVTVPTPLLVLSARLYGGGRAVEMATRLRSLNDIPNPARIEAGTTLRVEQRA